MTLRYVGTTLTSIADSDIKNGTVNIPETVTHIGSKAFRNCKSLTHINLPKGIKEIGTYAFDGCENLTHIDLPDGITHIGSNAFQGCTRLPRVVLPGSIISIGDGAFIFCTSLTKILIIIENADPAEMGRINALIDEPESDTHIRWVPKPIYQKVVISKTVYTCAREAMQKELEKLAVCPEINPLYPFVERGIIPLLPDDILRVANDFLENNDKPYYQSVYQSAKLDMVSLPIPEQDGEMEGYKKQLQAIVADHRNKVKDDVRNNKRCSIQTQYDNIKLVCLVNDQEAFVKFHQCCSELAEKHEYFKKRRYEGNKKPGVKPAFEASRDLLDELQCAFIEYVEECNEECNKDKRSDGETKTKFVKGCEAAIDKARKKLEKHRGFKKIFINLGIFFLTLGAGFLLNYLVTNRKHVFFRPETDSVKKLNHLSDVLDGEEFSSSKDLEIA